MGDLNLAVVSVGKTLVHHKRYTTQSKGVPTILSSKSELRKFLLGGNAILVADVAVKRAHRRRPVPSTRPTRSILRAS